MADDEEDDYLSMTFAPEATVKETSLQRTARLKKEAAERGRPLSKAAISAKAIADRDAALATELDASNNKGAKMMAKMGFTAGGTLGRSEDARSRPIELQIKDDRGGIGMDSEKKRKVREAAASVDKRQKVGLDEFRERGRAEREERKTEGQMWGAMRVLEGVESEAEVIQEDEGEDATTEVDSGSARKGKGQRLRDVNVLYRPLIKQRLERDRERKMRYDVNHALSNRDAYADDDDDDDEAQFDPRLEQIEDEDPELEAFESLPLAERLEKLVAALRQDHFYCFWCKYKYPDQEMEGCPGLTEDEHG